MNSDAVGAAIAGSAAVLTAPAFSGHGVTYWVALSCLGGAAGALAPYWQRDLVQPGRYAAAMVTGVLMSVSFGAGAYGVWDSEPIGVFSAVLAAFWGPRLVADPNFMAGFLSSIVKAWRGK
jgi:hypothetical protein